MSSGREARPFIAALEKGSLEGYDLGYTLSVEEMAFLSLWTRDDLFPFHFLGPLNQLVVMVEEFFLY